jgi:hypothetical protein
LPLCLINPRRFAGGLRTKLNTKRLGDPAEVTFLARTLELGLHLSKPFRDNDPYDWIVVNEQHILLEPVAVEDE